MHSLLLYTALCGRHAASRGWNVKASLTAHSLLRSAACWKHETELRVASASLISMLPPRGYTWYSSQRLHLPKSQLCSCPPSLWISSSFSPSFPFFNFHIELRYSFSRKKLCHSNLHILLHPRFVQHSPDFLFWTLVLWPFHYFIIISVPDILIQKCKPLKFKPCLILLDNPSTCYKIIFWK